MSHGPKISIHHDELSGKEKNKIRDLMQVAEVGEEDERLAVADHLNDTLDDMHGSLFSFWNHRPGQEVEDYDDLIEYFKLYARIVCTMKVCTARVTADYKDHRWFFDADQEWKVEEDTAEDNRDWFDDLKLKRQVHEGEKARQELED